MGMENKRFLTLLERNVSQRCPQASAGTHLSLSTIFDKNTSFLSALDPTNRFLGAFCARYSGALFFQSFIHAKVMLLFFPYEELPKQMSQTQGIQLCSHIVEPLPERFKLEGVRIRVLRSRRVAFTRTKNYPKPIISRREIRSGVKKYLGAEKLVILVENDQLLLKSLLLFEAFPPKTEIGRLLDISSRRSAFLFD